MRCEDEKMFYRPPLLEEPCAQTLSGKIEEVSGFRIAALLMLSSSKTEEVSQNSFVSKLADRQIDR